MSKPAQRPEDSSFAKAAQPSAPAARRTGAAPRAPAKKEEDRFTSEGGANVPAASRTDELERGAAAQPAAPTPPAPKPPKGPPARLPSRR
jgi:hypothetical protein